MNPALLAIVERLLVDLVQYGPTIIKDISDTKPFALAIIKTAMGSTPSDTDFSALEAQLTSLSSQLQAPLPPEE